MRKTVAFSGFFIIVILVSLVLVGCAIPENEMPNEMPMAEISVEEINRLIQEKGYTWHAGKTSVSGLSLEEKKRLCGDKLERRVEVESTQKKKGKQLPSAFDWRDYLGEDWTTEIRNQGDCNSCPAFANIAAFESILEILDGSPDANPDLSESYLFFCGYDQLCCSASCADGWCSDAARNSLRYFGVPDEDCWPYIPEDSPCTQCTVPCENCAPGQPGVCYCANVEDGVHHGGRLLTIDDWYELPDDVDSIKASIVNNGPVPTSMDVYEDFFDYDYLGGCYKYTMGDKVGYHAVTIVGYDDNILAAPGEYGAWICKSSWGLGWGEEGWFQIAYGECSIEQKAAELRKEATEVYIRDNLGDTGNTPTGAPYWLSPDLIVRNNDEGYYPDVWESQDVIRGQDNWIYVRVHNNGPNLARAVEVHVYKSNYLGTEFMYPWDYQNEISTSPVQLNYIASSMGPAVVKFKWPAAEIPAEDWKHPCLLASVDTTDDVDAGQWGICTGFSGMYVWENNNLAQRNIAIVGGKQGSIIEFRFSVGNVHSKPRKSSELAVFRNKTPEDATIKLHLRDMKPTLLAGEALVYDDTVEVISEEVWIQIFLGREPRDVYLTFEVPPHARLGEEYTVHVMQAEDEGRSVGGVTLLVRVVP
jgi:C1A family cysteine protease